MLGRLFRGPPALLLFLLLSFSFQCERRGGLGLALQALPFLGLTLLAFQLDGFEAQSLLLLGQFRGGFSLSQEALAFGRFLGSTALLLFLQPLELRLAGAVGGSATRKSVSVVRPKKPRNVSAW